MLADTLRRVGRVAGSADPYFSNVSLLLHMNGANGSTTFTDNSGSPMTVTQSGGTTISTAEYKFGGASGLFSSSRLQLPTGLSSLDIGNQDFTIEAWVYRISGSSSACLYVGQSDLNTASGSSIVLYVGGPSNSEFYIGGGNVSVPSPTFATGTWHHVAFCRAGSTFRSFLDGVQVGSNGSASGTINTGSTSYPPCIGSFGNGGAPLNCYIDDFRITKGVGRYTSTFTPPTAQFPDS